VCRVDVFSRLVLNSLYARDPAWLWNPELEVEAVRVGRRVYVRSRTRPGVVHVVQDGECSCEAARHGLACWHLEAAEFAVIRDEPPAWAPVEEAWPEPEPLLLH